MIDKVNLRTLFHKFILETISHEELIELYSYTESSDYSAIWHEVLENYYQENNLEAPDSIKERVPILMDDVWKNINLQIIQDEKHALPKRAKITKIYRYAAAAILLLTSLLGILYFNALQSNKLELAHLHTDDIQPGTNKATLTLSNGTSIRLSESQDGIEANEHGIAYQDGSNIVAVKEAEWVTLSTPRGGQYQVTLSDGTKVWLNAATTLRYPSKFEGSERHVDMEGEAYFEVQEMKEKPFIVSTGNQHVKVLGTAFNINAYVPENRILTTLLRGKVGIERGEDREILDPGQQAIVSPNTKMLIQSANVDDVIAWKEGYFMFNNEPLEDVMHRVGNWYNVDVEFDSISLKSEKVYGSISRSENLAQVLNILQKAGVATFEVNTRTIIVKTKK